MYSDYRGALAAISVLVMIGLVQTVLSAYSKIVKDGQPAGAQAAGDHNDKVFRVWRAHMNSVEVMPFILGAIVLCILAGASPLWVNVLAWVYVAARIVFWVAYVGRIGKDAGGIRTIAFVTGWAVNLALAIMGLIAVL